MPQLRHALRAAACTGLLLALVPGAHATSVAMQGSMGGKALLIVDGKPPRAVGAGERLGAVQVVSVESERAVVLIEGQRRTLRVGEMPSQVGGQPLRAGGDVISITGDGRGHFVTTGQINGRPTTFMVDTGASMVALSLADAAKMDIDHTKGRPIRMRTANGDTDAYHVKLRSIRIGEVEMFDVDAVITPQRMPYVLLGNSYLTRFQMRRDSDVLTLTRR